MDKNGKKKATISLAVAIGLIAFAILIDLIGYVIVLAGIASSETVVVPAMLFIVNILVSIFANVSLYIFHKIIDSKSEGSSNVKSTKKLVKMVLNNKYVLEFLSGILTDAVVGSFLPVWTITEVAIVVMSRIEDRERNTQQLPEQNLKQIHTYLRRNRNIKGGDMAKGDSDHLAHHSLLRYGDSPEAVKTRSIISKHKIPLGELKKVSQISKKAV